MRGWAAAIAVASSFWSTAAAGAPGDHIRLGEVVITPAISLGAGYRSNPGQLYAPSNNGGLVLTVSPSVTAAVKGPQLDFSLTGIYQLQKFTAPALVRYDRFVDFDVNASLQILKKNTVGFTFGESVSMNVDPTRSAAARPFVSHLNNNLSAEANIRFTPAFNLDVGGNWSFDDYSVPGDKFFTSFNRRHTFGPQMRFAWRFFPRTALVLDASYALQRWDLLDVNDGAGGFLSISNSDFFRIQAGLRGRITERLVVVATAGYGLGMYRDDDGPVDPDESVKGLERLLVSVGATYNLDERHSLSLNYQKNFADVFFSNYVGFHQIQVAHKGRYGRWFGSEANVQFRVEGYRGQETRDDLFLRAKLDGLVHFSKWLKMNVGGGVQSRFSNTDVVNYTDATARAGLTFTY